MSGNTIEAKLRIAADLASAITALRELRKELLDTAKAADQTGRQRVGTGVKQEANEAARASREATKEAAKEARQATADQRAADRAAAEERAKALRAERQARREAAEAERKERREKREADRQATQEAATARKAQRFESFKGVQLQQQVTDIVSGLATGQSPLTVLLQQGGQLRDIFGGIGNAGRALLSVITPLRVGVTLLATGLATVVYQAVQGQLESDRLNKTLALTGNVVGTSLGQVDALARSVATRQRAAIGDVRETIEALLNSSRFTGSTLDSAARAVTTLRKFTGATADEVVKDFGDMANGVTDWAERANKAYNFLTLEQFKYIRGLEAQGRTQEAMRVTMDALSQTLESRVAPAVGTIERLWRGAGDAVSWFLDRLKDIGRETTPEDRIKTLKKELEALIQARDKLEKRGYSKTGSAAREANAAVGAKDAELQQAQRELARQVQRTTDQRHANEEAQEKMRKEGLAFQSLLAQTELATAQKLLQQQLASLDARQAATDLAHAKGLVSEREYSKALSFIAQERLRAQEALLNRQLELEKRKLGTKAESGKARTEDERLQLQASVTQIEAQLIDVRSRKRVEAAKEEAAANADALQKARESAQQWAQAWQQAYDQVRELAQQNAAARASQIADPAARARAEAEATVADRRRAIAEQQRGLEQQILRTVNPEQKAELVRQLEELGRQGAEALARGLREGEFSSFQRQLAEQLDALRLKEADIDAQVERGAITTVEAERAKFKARAESIAQLDELLAKLAEAARSPAEENQVEAVRQNLGKLKSTSTELEKTLKGSFKSGFAQMFTDIVTGSEKADKAFGKFLASMAQSVLDMIAKDLGEQLLKSLVGSGQGGGDGGWINTAASWIASLFHTGGVVGRAGGMARAVSPLVFAGAQVLHGGGIAGLRSNETAAILEKGEEVLTTDDPRHVRNLRSSAGPVIGNLNISVSTDGGSGSDARDAEMAKGLARTIERKVREGIADEMRPGGLLEGRSA